MGHFYGLSNQATVFACWCLKCTQVDVVNGMFRRKTILNSFFSMAYGALIAGL
jgi:hypothetical protein